MVGCGRLRSLFSAALRMQVNVRPLAEISPRNQFPPQSHPWRLALSRFVSLDRASVEEAAAAKREYQKEIAVLRRKYAAELAEKQKREQKDEEVIRARVAEMKVERLKLKKERSAARAIEVEQEAKIIQDLQKEQKAANVKARNKLDARLGLVRHKRMMAIRRQSSMWIEEKDLERRIVEAISNPFHLRGSVMQDTLERDDSYYEEDEQLI